MQHPLDSNSLAPKLRTFCALFIVATAACAGNRFALGSERLTPGDYDNGEKGVFRRIVVMQNQEIPYDIWRADPHGVFTHLHFTLVSPKAFPVESTEYKVVAPGKTCDNLTVRLYREANNVHPEIIVLRFGNYEEPFAAAGERLSANSYRKDAVMVEKLHRDASDPNFYDTTAFGSRGELLDGVPDCR